MEDPIEFNRVVLDFLRNAEPTAENPSNTHPFRHDFPFSIRIRYLRHGTRALFRVLHPLVTFLRHISV